MPEIGNSIHRQYKIKDRIKYWNNKKEIRRKGKQKTNTFFCGFYASWNNASSQGNFKFYFKVGEMSVNSILANLKLRGRISLLAKVMSLKEVCTKEVI